MYLKVRFSTVSITDTFTFTISEIWEEGFVGRFLDMRRTNIPLTLEQFTQTQSSNSIFNC